MAKMIGVVGGIGSYAGIDLIRKIYDLSAVESDQDHLPVAMLSIPELINDRSDFLLNKNNENPAEKMAQIITTLVEGGAEIIGIPCNTAHAPRIFNRLLELSPAKVSILHMIEEVARYIREVHPQIKKVGVLSTNGTYFSGVYPQVFQSYGIQILQPSEDIQTMFVHPAIYDRKYGIKAHANPVTRRAISDLSFAATYLHRQGAEAIILGCTEIPLALTSTHMEDCPLLDATSILARALIRESKGISYKYSASRQ